MNGIKLDVGKISYEVSSLFGNEADIYVALYDEDGRLKSVSAGESGELHGVENQKDYDITIFAWKQ